MALPDSAYSYIATAQKPTGVTHAVVGNFTAAGEWNLVLARTHRLEVHTLTPEGLKPVLETGIYGRIATLRLFKLQGDTKDTLVLTTEKYQFVALSYDARAGKLRTLANGDVADRIGCPTERGQLSAVDPAAKVIAYHFYEGLLKLVPLSPSGFREKAFNVRLDEVDVRDIAFLSQGGGAPVLAVLFTDVVTGEAGLRTYTVDVAARALHDGPFHHTFPRGADGASPLDPGATLLLPLPAPVGGVLVIGRSSVAYHAGRATGRAEAVSAPLPGRILPKAPMVVDASRILVTDGLTGDVYLIAVGRDGGVATPRVSVTKAAGDAGCLPSCGAYLDGGYVFLGSVLGDSQLVRLATGEEGSAAASSTSPLSVEPVQPFTSLGPILDFCVVDLGRQGQGQVVAACGAYKSGSIRVVRSGIGIEAQAVVDIPSIRGLWGLRGGAASSGAVDRYLLLSLPQETRVFAMEGAELEEVERPGIAAGVTTLAAGVTDAGWSVQVTPAGVRIGAAGGGLALVGEWSPASLPGGARRITLGAVHGPSGSVLVALSGGHLALLTVDAATGNVTVAASRAFPQDIAALALPTPGAGLGQLAAVSFWTHHVLQLVGLPSLADAAPAVDLGTSIQASSLVLQSLGGVPYALVGTGDGKLVTFRVAPVAAGGAAASSAMQDDGEAGGAAGEEGAVAIAAAAAAGQPFAAFERKVVALGVQPVGLVPFRHKGAFSVFAGGDRPCVVFASGSKLLLSNFNVGAVTAMTPFSAESFPDCLAFANPEALTIGSVDDIQRLHIRTVPLGEQPRRIVHHAPSKTVLVAVEAARPHVPAPPKHASAAAAAAAASVAAASNSAPADVAGRALVVPDELVERGLIRAFDDASFDPATEGEEGGAFQLDPYEVVTAMTVARLTSPAEAAAAAAAPAAASSSSSSSSTAAPPGREYCLVGTSYIIEGEEEPTRGRILVLDVVPQYGGGGAAAAGEAGGLAGATAKRAFRLVQSAEVRGGVMSLAPLNDPSAFLAGINSRVAVYAWTKKGPSRVAAPATGGGAIAAAAVAAADAAETALTVASSYYASTLALSLDVRPGSDLVAVGDLMRSITVLRVVNRTITEVASHPACNWMTAVAAVDDRVFLGAESHYNLLTAVRAGADLKAAATGADALTASRLDVAGEFHVGELVNRFRAGSLVALPQLQAAEEAGGLSDQGAAKRPKLDASASSSSSSPACDASGVTPRFIYGTQAGSLGVVMSLPPALYKTLLKLQRAVNAVVPGVGGLSHTAWRAFTSERRLPNVLPIAGAPVSSPADVSPPGEATCFIDGDLVETFLDLAPAVQAKVVELMNGAGGVMQAANVSVFGDASGTSTKGAATPRFSVLGLTKVLEDLQRLH